MARGSATGHGTLASRMGVGARQYDDVPRCVLKARRESRMAEHHDFPVCLRSGVEMATSGDASSFTEPGAHERGVPERHHCQGEPIGHAATETGRPPHDSAPTVKLESSRDVDDRLSCTRVTETGTLGSDETPVSEWTRLRKLYQSRCKQTETDCKPARKRVVATKPALEGTNKAMPRLRLLTTNTGGGASAVAMRPLVTPTTDIWCIQELKWTSAELSTKRLEMEKNGWHMNALPCIRGPKGGRSAGVGIMSRSGMNLMDGTETKYKIPLSVIDGRCVCVLASFKGMGLLLFIRFTSGMGDGVALVDPTGTTWTPSPNMPGPMGSHISSWAILMGNPM